MTREEMWEEFESQLKSEVRTPITMSYNDSIRLAEMGIKDVVARWKKRLEQEPCSDAISRRAVLETLDDMDNVLDEDRTIENYKELLKECYEVLPPVNPQKWIPVSERLPNKDRYTDFYKCLVAVSCTSRNTICDSFTAYFDGKHFYRHLYDRAIISEVKAWMPLPQPYKSQEREVIE